MLQTLSSPRAEQARSRFLAAVALGRASVVDTTEADNRLLVCILGTGFGILAEIEDEAVSLWIKAPGHRPHLAGVSVNEDATIHAAVHSVFEQIQSGRIFG